jgi:hypothetical protein
MPSDKPIHYCLFIDCKDHRAIVVLGNEESREVESFEGHVKQFAVNIYINHTCYRQPGTMMSRYEYALAKHIGAYYIPKWRSFAATRSEAFTKVKELCMKYCRFELEVIPRIPTWFNNGFVKIRR